MPEFNPLHDLCVLIKNLSLLEVQGLVRFWAWGFNEWLVYVVRMENIVLKSEEPLNWSTYKFRMSKSVGNVFELLFWFYFYVIFITFVIEISGDWSVQSLLLPLLYVRKFST